ncbi:4390_t:CDS:1 [Acaulospora morrowiae]|uniref:4390_t:CDS:1 n=1 Tax=Acaulospora morrowiae TaxID=94023 RepID=A0A9N9FFV7_9GLOM|nr:4390_t:CDS:1 [Acaulospora morrowiae]
MDNTVGQEDSRDNVAAEEGVITSKKIVDEEVEKNVEEGEGKKDSMTGSTVVLIEETASTQNGAVEGDTDQLSAEVSKKADDPPETLKPQQSNSIPVSPKSGINIDLVQNIPASASNSYKPNIMIFKPENQISSESKSDPLHSDTSFELEHLAEISEDGMLALRFTETERTGPLMNTGSAEPLSPSTNTSNTIAPKQIVRIERDYSKGELCQFQTAFPMEIDGRVNHSEIHFWSW